MSRDDLIAALQAIPENLPVYVRAYEFGYLDMKPECVKTCEILLNYNEDPCYGGPHEIEEDGTKVNGIVIDRYGWE